MFKTLISIVAFEMVFVASFATGTLHAQIFDSSGPDAPLVLFDADDYNPGAATWPNIGTGGATNNAFAPAGDYAFLNDPPYYVNAHPDPTEPDLGPPTKTVDAFASMYDGVTFATDFITVSGPEGPQTFPIGQGLIFDITGLPKGTDREVTFFAVFNKQFNSRSGIIGYGKVEETECCLDENDNMTLLTTTEVGPFPGSIALLSDDGRANAPSPPGGTLAYFAGATTIASATVQSDDAVRFAIRSPELEEGVLQTSGPVPFNADLDNTLADLGHIGFYFDFRPRPMDGNVAMLAIVPGAMDDTKRDMIVNDLYERYVNGGNEPLIMMAPGGVLGDFNGDNKVDAADYVVWRKNEAANDPLPNDNGVTTQQERYDLWVGNFGNMGSGSNSVVAAVPEPATVFLLLPAVCSLLLSYYRHRRDALTLNE